jgi:uncharacterized protein (TIGR02266 family)
MSPNPAARPSPSREAELARAESELTGQEHHLSEQLARALSEAAALAQRLEQVRSALTRPEATADGGLWELGARLQAAAVPELASDVEASRARALAAREQALEIRRQAHEDVQEALRAFQEQTAGLSQEVLQAEAGLKRAAEAAARAQREQEAQARRAQEAARAAQSVAARVPAGATATAAPAFSAAAAQKGRERGRVKLQAAIDLRSDSNFFTGFSTNISEGGVFIATVQPVARGTQVELDVTLPGGRPLRVSGVVRWSREVNTRTPDLMPGVGVQFTDLSPEVASAINAFVVRREPLFFPD